MRAIRPVKPAQPKIPWLSALLMLVFMAVTMATGCTFLEDPALESQLAEYFYRHQPSTGSEFVSWAKTNLNTYSVSQVNKALLNEAGHQADQGHPNAVGVMSFAAQAWAKENGLQYDPNAWQEMSKKALENVKKPSGTLQLWPKK